MNLGKSLTQSQISIQMNVSHGEHTLAWPQKMGLGMQIEVGSGILKGRGYFPTTISSKRVMSAECTEDRLGVNFKEDISRVKWGI